MACLIPRPSPQALFDRNRDAFSANVLGGSPVIPESNEWYVVSLNYARDEEFYAISEQQWKERDPRFACCDNLLLMAAADGVYPNPAGFASGYVILTGVGGSPLPTSIEIIAGGQNYITSGIVPQFFPTSGNLTLLVTATTAGVQGNAQGSVKTGTLATSITGVNSDVTVCGGNFCGGSPAETCEQFRVRYISRKQYQPRANQAWAINKLLEWPCATRVIPRGGNCCACDNGCGGDCACATCGGTLDFYVMFDGSFPCGVPPANILADIQTWFFGAQQGFGQGQVEIGVCGSIVQPVPFYVDVVVDILGCPTASQMTEIRSQIEDLFTTIAPSTDTKSKQVEIIVAGVVGGAVEASARFAMVTPDISRATINNCGDILPTCDSLPCLRNVTFTGPSVATGTTCP